MMKNTGMVRTVLCLFNGTEYPMKDVKKFSAPPYNLFCSLPPGRNRFCTQGRTNKRGGGQEEKKGETSDNTE
jgi:hypothetical protein